MHPVEPPVLPVPVVLAVPVVPVELADVAVAAVVALPVEEAEVVRLIDPDELLVEPRLDPMLLDAALLDSVLEDVLLRPVESWVTEPVDIADPDDRLADVEVEVEVVVAVLDVARLLDAWVAPVDPTELDPPMAAEVPHPTAKTRIIVTRACFMMSSSVFPDTD